MARLYPETAQNAALNAINARSDSITTPPPQDFDTPAMSGSMQQFLSENLGQYVVIEFLVGTQTLTSKAGVLYAVGTSVVTLYQELSQTFVTCDIFSVKFVTFYLPGHRPWQVNNPLFGQGGTTPGLSQWESGAGQTDSSGQWSPNMGQSGQWTPGMGQSPASLGQSGMAAPGFAPPMDTSGSVSGCVGGNCGGGATSPSWG